MATGKKKPAGLNPKRAAFVREYLKDSNATQAAIRAKYSEKTAYSQGQRLLKNAEVAAALGRSQQKAEKQALVDRVWVLTKLRENVERSMTAEPVLGPDGEKTGEWKYQGQVANKALELLGKDIGMFVQKIELDASEPVKAGLARVHEALAKKREREGGE